MARKIMDISAENLVQCKCGGCPDFVPVEEFPKPDHEWSKVACPACGLETEILYHKGFSFAAWNRGQVTEV